jgi:hypothetical protein
MAVAVFIIALLLGSILVPLETQIENRQYADTQRILEQARETLLGFAAANGYFPCPADATSNGREATGFDHTGTGSCPASVTGSNTYVGFFPAAALGFTPIDSQGYALDGWGLTQNRIRYAVSNQNIGASTRTFVSQNTSSSGMREATMQSISTATNLLYVCNSGTGVTTTDCGTAVSLISNAPVVIWSLGANAATVGGSTPHESKNLDDNRIFVMHDKSNVSGAQFDDVVTWISPSMLFSRLIASGQLP